MKLREVKKLLVFPLWATMALLCCTMMSTRTANAQQGDDSGYRTNEDAVLPPNPQEKDSDGYTVNDEQADKGDLKAEGPVRMARFAYVSGNVTWRPDSSGDWTQATVNMPMRQGAEVMVLKGGRADIQFDDGSSLRLGNSALISLKTLYSDSKGEFTQVTLKDGLATMRSRHAESVFEVDTPIVAVRTTGAARIRLGVDGGSEVAVQMGSAAVEGPQGKTTVQQGNYVYLTDKTTAYNARPIPAPDTWDTWNGERDALMGGDTQTSKHVPPNIGLVAGDLDQYGTWHNDPKYGWVWAPNDQANDWRPYNHGRWTWVEPFGWTWVGDEPWGWAPYHYGTWVNLSWGWSWCPGPQSQYWSPGVVSFTDYGGGFGWAPLCPWEVVYPAYCGLGIWGPNWGFGFSIGWCGCYFPFRGGFCEGRRFDNHFVNGFRHGFGEEGRFASQGRFNGPGEAAGANHGFVPFNAAHAAGATTASKTAFGGRGSYQAAPKGTNIFSGGHTVSAAAAGRQPVSGPSGAKPTAGSETTTRGFTRTSPSSAASSRSVFSSSTASNFTGRSSVGATGAGSAVARTAFGSSSYSPAEAARAARASLGSAYSGSAGYARSGGTASSGFSGRSSSGGSFDTPRSSGYGSYSGSRGYSGGSYSGSRSYSSGSYSGSRGSYRVGPSYGGAGSSRGGVSGGGGHSGGGGGGHR